MQSMADRLILLRNKYNLSQTDVAHQIGVTPALISAYEKLSENRVSTSLLHLQISFMFQLIISLAGLSRMTALPF